MKSQKVIALLLSTALSISTSMPLGEHNRPGERKPEQLYRRSRYRRKLPILLKTQNHRRRSHRRKIPQRRKHLNRPPRKQMILHLKHFRRITGKSLQKKRKPKQPKTTRIPMKAMPPFLHRRQNHRKQTPPQLKKRQILPPQKILHLLQTQQIRTKPKAVLQSPVKQILSEMMQ